jgi:hypothetical protein
LWNVVVAARAWHRARRTQDRRAVADAKKRLMRAVEALEAAPLTERRRRGW